MKLPEFDERTNPTVCTHWRRLWPRRRGAFWWYVGCVVKVRRVRHNDVDKIKEVCRLVDQAYPQYRKEKLNDVNECISMPRPQRVLRGT